MKNLKYIIKKFSQFKQNIKQKSNKKYRKNLNTTYKMVATDVDDTIIPKGKKDISLKTFYMFKKLHKANIVNVWATGRDFVTLNDLIYTKYIDYIIGANGAFVYDVDKQKIIFQHLIKIDDYNWLIGFFKYYKIKFAIIGRKHIYHSNNFDVSNWPYLKPYLKKVKSLSTFFNWSNRDDVYMITVVDDGKLDSNIQQMVTTFIDAMQLNVHISSRFSAGFFIMPKTSSGQPVNKLSSLEQLAKYKNISNDEIIAFGDSQNDIDMLESVGYSIAMGNALEEVKQIAKDVTYTDRKNGVYKKLKELKIIK